MSKNSKISSKKSTKTENIENMENVENAFSETLQAMPTPIIGDDLFCENCDNLLDISRVPLSITDTVEHTPSVMSDSNESTKTETEKEIDYESILRKVETDTKLSEDELRSIDIKEMIQHPYYKKINKKAEIKKLIMDMIEDLGNSDDNTKAYLVCRSCGFTKQIQGKMKIFSKKPEGVVANHDVIDEANYRDRIYCRTMPRTRNFTCSNKDCPSHDKKVPTEAIFFRKNQLSYETIHVCTVCSTVKVN